MKNRLLTLAGCLALLAVLGKYLAVPMLAQAVRAVLVKNIDERARIPYQANGSCDFLSHDDVPHCIVLFPVVPAGKRLVIEYVNALLFPSQPVSVPDEFLVINFGSIGSPYWAMPVVFENDHSFEINSSTLIYVEAGNQVSFASGAVVESVHIAGYLVDLTQ